MKNDKGATIKSSSFFQMERQARLELVTLSLGSSFLVHLKYYISNIYFTYKNNLHIICIINIPTNIYIIIFVVVKMKQHESLTILPSPIISRIGGYLTSLRNVHPSLSPLGFRRCGYFEEHFAFLLSITLPILF